ncbi:Splicing factor ESS-2 homolog [Eumeta japonica]|uniref:Splicing factor ESS-2 homolog n=1 Tax=Eumeta variegata TaxID=151549 RepID=A0A4C1Y6L7_EUMVA|nr:Splicing factor ESS-2 homolog [Eumeta japonica]
MQKVIVLFALCALSKRIRHCSVKTCSHTERLYEKKEREPVPAALYRGRRSVRLSSFQSAIGLVCARTVGDATVSGKIGVDGVCVSTKNGSDHGFVATPSPHPGDGPDSSPLMTWGEIEGTPFRLDGGDTPLPAVGAGAAYRMLEWGARERLALQLAEQAAKRRRPTTPRQTPPTPR